MTRVYGFTVLWIAMTFLLSACGKGPSAFETRIVNAGIDPLRIADWIIQGRNDFQLIDLRTHAQFIRSHIRGAIAIEPEALKIQETLKALPDYKKLVFYGENETLQLDHLRPVFDRGHHILILTEGFQGWQKAILTSPKSITTTEDFQRDAVVKYFKGESTLGTPQPLQSISAEQFIRLPGLKPVEEGPVEEEGC